MRFRRSCGDPWDRRRGPWFPRPPEPDTRVAIGLGSNLGDRLHQLRHACGSLASDGEIVRRSSIWETAPIGPRQPDYLNAVVVIDTLLGPRPLLSRCLDIERAQGRLRRNRWGPRAIDLDIILYSDASITVPGLRIPHPQAVERRFVLEPLAEAWPGAVVPGHGVVEELLPEVAHQRVVRTALEW